MNKNNFIFFIFSFLLVGCSSTYTIKNFTSKEKFYEEFNRSAKNKTVKVTLTNDSSITALNGANISNDSLFFTNQVLKEEKIESNEIKNIKYLDTGSSNLAAIIILNNGKELKAKKANMLGGSSINAWIVENELENLPLSKIKRASYNKNCVGVPIGLLSGTVLGYFSLGIANGLISKGSKSDTIVYPIASILIGGVIGWIVGYDYTYQFNP